MHLFINIIFQINDVTKHLTGSGISVMHIRLLGPPEACNKILVPCTIGSGISVMHRRLLGPPEACSKSWYPVVHILGFLGCTEDCCVHQKSQQDLGTLYYTFWDFCDAQKIVGSNRSLQQENVSDCGGQREDPFDMKNKFLDFHG